jgi:hypothetical protein
LGLLTWSPPLLHFYHHGQHGKWVERYSVWRDLGETELPGLHQPL